MVPDENRNVAKGDLGLNIKGWILWLFSSICFIFVGVMYLVDKKNFLGATFTLLGITYIFISITQYKKDKQQKH